MFVFLFMACSSDAASQAMPKVSDKGDSIVQNSKGAAPTVKLNSGFDMPVLGLGTWTLRGKVAEDAVYVAIKNGYRLIDTAKYYDNEEAVGRGIRRAIDDGLVKREDLFVTSKLVPWSNSLDEDIDDSLEKLGLKYIDLMLLHQHGSDTEDKAVYKAMERAVKAKKSVPSAFRTTTPKRRRSAFLLISKSSLPWCKTRTMYFTRTRTSRNTQNAMELWWNLITR